MRLFEFALAVVAIVVSVVVLFFESVRLGHINASAVVLRRLDAVVRHFVRERDAADRERTEDHAFKPKDVHAKDDAERRDVRVERDDALLVQHVVQDCECKVLDAKERDRFHD